jgi:hypothetical protein
MTYKQILVPDKKNHTIEMPEEFFGKKVEITVVEIVSSTSNTYPVAPLGKKVKADELFESFGKAPDFPSVEEIRSKAWPSKW